MAIASKGEGFCKGGRAGACIHRREGGPLTRGGGGCGGKGGPLSGPDRKKGCVLLDREGRPLRVGRGSGARNR